jgi:hypothetical protein
MMAPSGLAAGGKIAFVIVKFLATGPMSTDWNATGLAAENPFFFLDPD